MRLIGLTGLFIAGSFGCNRPPDTSTLQQVGYRTGIDGANSGERGTIKISEIGWAGSMTNDGTYDRTDVFVEIRNESNRQMRLDNWIIEMEGPNNRSWRIPRWEPAADCVPPEGQTECELPRIGVGDHFVIAAKTSGCFPNAQLVIPGMYFGRGDAFQLTLLDADERLIEPAGNRYNDEPFAGTYDGQTVRSMEKAELMFGGRGSDSESWHHYTKSEVEVVNNDLVAENCRERTLASPGRPNSPDYSGAFSAGTTD